jgi:hypothetical protein
MKTQFEIGAVLAAAAIIIPLTALGQVPADVASIVSAEQQEADWRVIAARCGTPAFEKAFYKQSKAAVAAGLVTRNRDPVLVEKAVTNLRRSPIVLVAGPADCPAELKQLAELQKSRSALIKTAPGRRAAAR